MSDYREQLIAKIKTLSETIWEGKAKGPDIDKWLGNFTGDLDESLNENVHALYLLSQFMYFGIDQLRELFKSLFRDLYKYPIVESVRQAHNDTTDIQFISRAFNEELRKTRFLGVGNPSESGCHLLYYFRQENGLPSELFIHSHQIFKRDEKSSLLSLRSPEITRYVFIDDFCGSARQAKDYSKDVVEIIKDLNKDVEISYYVLFATSSGIEIIKQDTLFDDVKAVFTLDDSYKCFGSESRYFIRDHSCIDKDFAKKMCQTYGRKLWSSHPLGFNDCQLLIGFNHNTPDNTLPIIWYNESDSTWIPIFRRYAKL